MNDLAETKTKALTPEVTPMQMLQAAVEQNDLDKMEKFMELQERWEANEARKAYTVAMTSFKGDPPVIYKNKLVGYENKDGSVTGYRHASLDHVVDAIGAGLAKHGLSHRWDICDIEGGQIKVTCIITHEKGHSESVSLQAGADSTGKKNNIQAKGSTVTYLQRYTLLSATGLAAKGQDDDGQSAEVERITEEQANQIHAMITENNIPKAPFLKFMKCESIETITAQAFSEAINALKRKIKASK